MNKDLINSEQYLEWLDDKEFEKKDDEILIYQLKNDLNNAKSMNQYEYTLWQKWEEIKKISKSSNFFDIKKIKGVKKKIWIPRKPEEFLNLEPELVLAQQEFPVPSVSIWGHERFDFFSNPDPLSEDWEIMRYFVATMPHGGNVGRSLRFIVRDRISKKYLGILCLSGDFLAIRTRDDSIGWSKENRVDHSKLNNTANGSVIIPTQPLGFSYLGGKLLSVLLASDSVARAWEQIYGDILVGVSTTSLYGTTKTATQYDGLKNWKNLGYTEGDSTFRPTVSTQIMMRDWMLNNHPFEFWYYYRAKRANGQPYERDSNERARRFCYEKLGFKKREYVSKHTRGIYFCRLYKNTDAFLRNEISKRKLVPEFDNSVEVLTEYWKKKAGKRVASLEKKNRFSYESTFYDDMLSLSWDQTKERYL